MSRDCPGAAVTTEGALGIPGMKFGCWVYVLYVDILLCLRFCGVVLYSCFRFPIRKCSVAQMKKILVLDMSVCAYANKRNQLLAWSP